MAIPITPNSNHSCPNCKSYDTFKLNISDYTRILNEYNLPIKLYGCNKCNTVFWSE
jgi:hypothetical protein